MADVFLVDGRIVNHELVRAGFAWHFAKYAPGDGTLARLEAQARSARRGLWSEQRATPPWKWRGRTRKGQSELIGADEAE